MTHYYGISESAHTTTPPTVLDGVTWPGLSLLLLGVLTLAWTLTGTDSDDWTIAGASATAVALISGFVWITIEHNRFHTEEQSGS
ncbi:hypothetical protein [Nocardia jejuensis]|uniref:hypothetical protein n=1 Tax=Nocardia jejuensis TaxID=328049 RepID=UPI000836DF09|nr:hypothetical protein [Nocardia jejuensis]